MSVKAEGNSHMDEDNTALRIRISYSDAISQREAYDLLRQRLEEWNMIAIAHGATEPPYAQEVASLVQIISCYDSSIEMRKGLVDTISVSTLRLLKAALMFALSHHEQELRERENKGWPSTVVEATSGKVIRFRQLVASNKYPPADFLSEILPQEVYDDSAAHMNWEWDVFICHATEDKHSIVDMLVQELRRNNVRTWYDDLSLSVGDSLRRSIDKGLARSKYGIVVLSPAFFKKEWPQKELDGLVTRESDGRKVILPIWHKVSRSDIEKYSPTLADRKAASTNEGVEHLVHELLPVIKGKPKLGLL